MRSKLDLTNCLAILRACDKRPRTAGELLRATKMSRATLYRTLIDLREQLAADVACEDGQYRVHDWGLLDRSRAR
jgi:DNA-binding IclR family transcriptional regulator